MISRVITAPTFGSYYYEDVAALQNLSVPEGERWFAEGTTPGFVRARELAETISVAIGDNERLGWGDCVGVSYAGKSGRKTLFRHSEGLRDIQSVILPWLKGRSITSFRDFGFQWSEFIRGLKDPLHPAIGYGVTAAALNYLSDGGDLFRVIAREWGLSASGLQPLPLQGSSGNNRYENADKMIARRLPALPQSQVDDIKSQVGFSGEVLLDYAKWLVGRLARFNIDGYRPVISLDVHGAIGVIFAGDLGKVADYLCRLEDAVRPYQFRIESPALAHSVDQQIDLYAKLRKELVSRRSTLLLAADEWANTKEDIIRFADSGCVDLVHVKCPDLGNMVDVVDASLYCKARGVQVLLGGSCVETELSTRATVHIGMVIRPDFLLLKPGMGFDEGFMLCQNEMARISALSK